VGLAFLLFPSQSGVLFLWLAFFSGFSSLLQASSALFPIFLDFIMNILIELG